MKIITDYAGRARATDGKTPHLPLSPIASHEKISAATGKDLSGFTHVLDAAKIRHILDTHGDPVKEAKHGQRAVVEADFAKLALVVDAHDTVTLSTRPANGNLSVLEFMKRIGDEEFHYRAEIRAGKMHLAPATLFIKVVK